MIVSTKIMFSWNFKQHGMKFVQSTLCSGAVVTFNTRPSRTFVEINPWLPYSIVNASVNILVCGLKLSGNTFLRYVFVFLVYCEKE